jgi:hypothetical protein
MKYHLSDAIASLAPGQEWACRDQDYDQIIWFTEKNSLPLPSKAALEAEVTRLNAAEPMRLLREERDKRLSACDWVVTKSLETDTPIPTAWSTYRQALRDLTETATPELNNSDWLDMSSVSWPVAP